MQQEFVPARTRSRKSPTRVLLCRLGPLVWSRPRCRTTVPQLASRPDQRPRTAPASHTTRPPTARTPIYVPLRARGTWVWFIRQRCRSRGTIAQQRPTKGSSAPPRGPTINHVRMQRVVRARLATLLRVCVRAGYHHSTRADRWQETPAVNRTTESRRRRRGLRQRRSLGDDY